MVAEVMAWFQRWVRSVENGTGALRGGPTNEDGAGGVVGSKELSNSREEWCSLI
jgi:hypothetical protein